MDAARLSRMVLLVSLMSLLGKRPGWADTR